MAEAPNPSLVPSVSPALSAELPTSTLEDFGFERVDTSSPQPETLTDLGFEEYSPEGFRFTDLITKPVGRATSRLLGSDIPDEALANIWVDIGRLGPQIYGGYKGGQYGLRAGQAITAPLPIPPQVKGGIIGATTLGGTVVGSVAGAGSPEAVMAMPDFLLGTEFQEKYGTSPEYMRTLLEGEAVLELLMPGVLGVGRQTARLTARGFTGLNAAASDLAERAAERGINLMPVQLGRGYRGGIGRMYVSVLGRFPFVAGPIRNVAKELDQEAQDYLRTIENKTGLNLDQVISRSELGENILQNGREILDGFLGHFGRLYDQQDALAAANNIYVIPDALVSKAGEIKSNFLRRTLGQTGETASRDAIDTINNKFTSWLDENVLNMKVTGEPRYQAISPTYPGGINPRTGLSTPPVRTQVPVSQGLDQFDSVPQSFEVVKSLDRQIESFMSDLTADQQKLVQPELQQLRQALSADLIQNVRQFAEPITSSTLSRGQPLPELLDETPFLREFIDNARQLDADFSHTMKDLFETPTANRFARWTRGGLRGLQSSLEKSTQLDPDTVARNLVNLGNARAIDEFYNIVKPTTYNDAVANYLNDAFFKATRRTVENEAGEMVEIASDAFDPEKFIKALGLDLSKADPKYQNLKHFFDKSNLYSMDELEQMADVFRAMGSTEIPDVSTFITRRIQLGGIRTLLPFGAAAAGGFGGLVPLALALGGGRLLSSIIADPLNARLLRNVLAEESARGTKTINTIRKYGNLLRGGLRTMYDNDMFEGEDQRQELVDRYAATDALLEVYEEALEDPQQFAAARYREAEDLEQAYLGEEKLIPRFWNWLRSLGSDPQDVEDIAEYIRNLPQQQSSVAVPPPFSPMREDVPLPPLNVAQQMPPVPQQQPPAPQQQGIAASPENRARFAAMFPNDLASGVIRSQGIGSLV